MWQHPLQAPRHLSPLLEELQQAHRPSLFQHLGKHHQFPKTRRLLGQGLLVLLLLLPPSKMGETSIKDYSSKKPRLSMHTLKTFLLQIIPGLSHHSHLSLRSQGLIQ